MEDINRLTIVLAEKKRTNTSQSDLRMLTEIANILNVERYETNAYLKEMEFTL